MSETEVNPTPVPKRRWFRFSLRGLFVGITLFGIFLGLNIHTVAQRRSMRAQIEAKGGMLWQWPYDPCDKNGPFAAEYAKAIVVTGDTTRQGIPPWRCWLGDEPIGFVFVPMKSTSPADLATISRTFPGAEIFAQ